MIAPMDRSQERPRTQAGVASLLAGQWILVDNLNAFVAQHIMVPDVQKMVMVCLSGPMQKKKRKICEK